MRTFAPTKATSAKTTIYETASCQIAERFYHSQCAGKGNHRQRKHDCLSDRVGHTLPYMVINVPYFLILECS